MSFSHTRPEWKRFVKSNEVKTGETNLSEGKGSSALVEDIQGIDVRKTYEQIVGVNLSLPGVTHIERESIKEHVRPDSRSDDIEHTPADNSASASKQRFNQFESSSMSDLNKPSLNALMRCAEQNNTHVLKKALIQDPNLVRSVDQFGWSLLMVAACAGADKVVEILLSAGADTGYRDRRGYSCISLARKKGHSKIVEIIQKFRSSKPPVQIAPKPNVKNQITRSQLCSSCCQNYDKSDHQRHLTSTVHQLSKCSKECRTFYSIPGSNRGYQIMLKEGWDGQKGLGPSGNGVKLPPKTVLKRDRKGLGASKGTARITHFHSHDPKAVTGCRTSKINSQHRETKHHLRQQIQHDKLLERTLRRELS